MSVKGTQLAFLLNSDSGHNLTKQKVFRPILQPGGHHRGLQGCYSEPAKAKVWAGDPVPGPRYTWNRLILLDNVCLGLNMVM